LWARILTRKQSLWNYIELNENNVGNLAELSEALTYYSTMSCGTPTLVALKAANAAGKKGEMETART
jgi:hypothetical protein